MAAPAFDTIENTQIPCLLNRKIDNGRFVLERRIGHGGYSVVYLARDLHARSPAPTHVAVKCVLDRRQTKTAREVTLHRRASNIPGCVKILRTLHETGLYFVILEYCPNGDLFTMITEKKLFLGRDDLIKPVFLQLLDSVAALHRMGIYHRDLKPENVLCVMSGGQSTGMKVFIADFGLATEWELSKSFGCGSYFYMTPECLAGSYSSAISAYSSRAADIWALGIILVNLICARSPWKVAMLSDESFARYTRSPRWLRSMLPLSAPAYAFLDRIFANHGNNVRLEDLRAQFLEIDTFYMSPAELAGADKTARLVAREWMPEAPLDDIKQEDILKMAHVGEVDEAVLFDDSVHTDGLESESPTTDGSGTDVLSSLLISCTSTESASSGSDFPITPESKPAQPAEGVPELPANQKMGEQWVLSSAQVLSFHEVLTAAQVEPSMENLII